MYANKKSGVESQEGGYRHKGEDVPELKSVGPLRGYRRKLELGARVYLWPPTPLDFYQIYGISFLPPALS